MAHRKMFGPGSVVNDAHRAMSRAEELQFKGEMTAREIEQFQDWAALNPSDPMAMPVWRLCIHLLAECRQRASAVSMLREYEKERIGIGK